MFNTSMIDKSNNSSSERILFILKTEGAQTASVLAKKLKITSMGARQHLQNMTDDGVIEYQDIKQGRGRPARYWTLTKAADTYFPNMHSELTIQLMNAVEEVFGEEGLDQLIEVRKKNALSRYQNIIKDSNNLEEKLFHLAKIRGDEGYMTSVNKIDDGFLFNENHCPISKAANKCKGFCDSELLLFREVLGDNYHIERAEHILSNSRRCSYHISEK